jgi:hypothetical protein
MREFKFAAWDGFEMVEGLSISEAGDLVKVRDVQLLEWTGIQDRNGKDVYVGYLIAVVIPTTGRRRIAEVVFYEGKLKYCKRIVGRGEKYSGLTNPGRTHHNFEVIGNVYQNPELLKQP